MNGGDSKPDPIASSRQSGRVALPKRFYKRVAIVRQGADLLVTLDGRKARTPAGSHLAVSSDALAEALMGEWEAQKEYIDPAAMPVTRIVNAALDRVGTDMEGVRKEIVRYAGNDLLCYRAEGPESLLERQEAIWGPVIAWAELDLGLAIQLTTGVIAIEQPPEVALAVAGALTGLGVLPLAGVHTATTLTGSALLALALFQRALSPDQTWQAAYVDEDWQMERWGRDEVMLELRALRREEFDAAILAMRDE